VAHAHVRDKTCSLVSAESHNAHHGILSNSEYSRVSRGDSSDNPAPYAYWETGSALSLDPHDNQHRTLLIAP
jgi:hypothetical protein